MTDHDAETDAIVAELEAAGILAVTTEADGTVTYALTREGKAIGRQLAMTQGEDARLAVLNELLDGADWARQAAEAARWGYSAAGSSGAVGASPTKTAPTTAAASSVIQSTMR
jgi:hypothetical protein